MPLAALWRERERPTNQNPVYPYEWELRYADGTRFPREWQGVARRTADAPKAGIVSLEVWGPGLRETILPTGQIDEVVVRARVARSMPDLKHGLIGGWVFGFRGAGRFQGIAIDAAGRVARQEGTPA